MTANGGVNLDGSDVQRLTDRVGYDGGAFYSPDGSQIIWRAHYPPEGGEEAEGQEGETHEHAGEQRGDFARGQEHHRD